MKLLVLGATGMLGSGVCCALKEEGFEVHGTFRNKTQGVCLNLKLGKAINFDASENKESLPLSDYKYVINCIGIINRLTDQNVPNAIYINSLFPHLMARRCQDHNVKFIHITTDCVFDGKLGKYNEDSPHYAHDVYGKTKSLGETKECMTLRTSIIGEEKHQHHSLVSWAQSQKNKEVKGYTNHYWNGVTTHQYGKIISQIIKENLYQEDLFHIFSPNDVTKFNLLRMLSDRFHLNLNISAHTTEFLVDRTLRTTKKLQKTLFIPSVEEQIKQL